MKTDELIARLESFAAARGIAPATVTSRALGNSRLYARMKAGGSCTLPTAERLWAFMENHSSSTSLGLMNSASAKDVATGADDFKGGAQ